MLSKFRNALNYLRLTLNTPSDSPFKVTDVKCNPTIGLPIYEFLLRLTNNFTTYKAFKVPVTWTLTLQGYQSLNMMVLLDAPYMISYWCLIVTHGLTRLLYKI